MNARPNLSSRICIFRSTIRNRILAIFAAFTWLGFLSVPAFGILAELYPSNTGIGGFDEAHGDGMVGWVFSVQTPVTVTAVGWYDDGADGLSRAFQVGLWQDLNGYFAPGSNPKQLLGTPAAGITIPAGTAAPLQNSYRIVSLRSPLTLQPGNYQLAGLDSAATTDPIKYVELSYNPPPINGISNDGFFYAPFSSPTFAMTNSSDFYLYWGLELGPMLFTPIPEPADYAGLIGVGAIGIVAMRRRHQRSGDLRRDRSKK
jgi:hypothetical protein